MLNQPQQAKPVGPYCPFPRDTYDDTCIHPPGCAEVVDELRREHRIRIGLEKRS